MEVPFRPLPYEQIRIETERTVLRAWNPDQDADDAFAIYSDPQVAEFLTGVVEESVETQRESLGRICRAYGRMGCGYGGFALELRDTGRVVGAGLLKPLPRTEELAEWVAFREGGPPPPIHEIEVGWHLARAYWGQGYATEAGAGLLDYAFRQLELPEVFAILYRANRRSAAVARRLGMEHLGPTEAYYGVEGELYRARVFPA